MITILRDVLGIAVWVVGIMLWAVLLGFAFVTSCVFLAVAWIGTGFHLKNRLRLPKLPIIEVTKEPRME